jgi:hypothetical protein
MASRPETSSATVARIAQVVHEAIRAWQKANGQKPSPVWSRAPEWMKESSRAVVVWAAENPRASARAHHERWLRQMETAGWRYGVRRNDSRKTHPMMVPYSDLPEIERRKDALVAAVIDALALKIR